MKTHKCKMTGRRWIEVGWLGIGFGPEYPIERIFWKGRVVWYKKVRKVKHAGR